jgi:hypothetical protein
MRIQAILLACLAVASAAPGRPAAPAMEARSSASGASAASVAGKWKGTAKTSEGRLYDLQLDLSSEGDKVSGTLIANEGTVPIEDGRVEGDQFTFKLSTDDGVYTMKLTVAADHMKGRYTGPGGESGEIAVSR